MCDKIYTIDEIKSIAAPIAKQHGVAACWFAIVRDMEQEPLRK